MAHSPEQAPNPADKTLPTRRSVFEWLTYGMGALATAVLTIPFVGYLLGVKKKPPQWVDLGPVSEFTGKEDENAGQTVMKTFDNPLQQPWDGMTAQTGVYVRYEGKNEGQHQFLILAVNCAHLGCPVSWFPQSGLFMCPCHGGVYYADGKRASGPPPRGLFQCESRIVKKKGVERLEVQAPHYPTLQAPLRPGDTGNGHG